MLQTETGSTNLTDPIQLGTPTAPTLLHAGSNHQRRIKDTSAATYDTLHSRQRAHLTQRPYLWTESTVDPTGVGYTDLSQR